ncbi:hypothetical protein E2C01_055764 [Portunus trituberculatus]|uniref:Uncharacterized protein n=1 Tax=Portunus trituberculatus TaxID=210409 RepID=A0A5B7GVX2_PORTR|nr:hypothetical protein [Portunus trituberculatus]
MNDNVLCLTLTVMEGHLTIFCLSHQFKCSSIVFHISCQAVPRSPSDSSRCSLHLVCPKNC